MTRIAEVTRHHQAGAATDTHTGIGLDRRVRPNRCGVDNAAGARHQIESRVRVGHRGGRRDIDGIVSDDMGIRRDVGVDRRLDGMSRPSAAGPDHRSLDAADIGLVDRLVGGHHIQGTDG